MGIVSSVLAVFNNLRYGRIKPQPGSVYDFRIRSLGGQEIDFGQYRGKKLLIVNTASKCGYTPQLKQLQQLHQQYRGKLNVLGFPSNDFLWQEPGTHDEISAFCELNYGITFQMFEKVPVSGSRAHPLFKWLAGRTGKFPSWNFCKYFVDERGDLVEFFSSKVEPMEEKILSRIV